MKTIASFRDCVQIGPEDWEMRTRFFEVNEDTTVGEIVKWYRSKYKSGAFMIAITEEEPNK